MAGTWAQASLVIAFLTEGAVIAGIGLSIIKPEYRIWPPAEMNWKFWYYWGGSSITATSLAIVGYSTAGSFFFQGMTWKLIGGIPTATGLLFAGWSGYVFRVSESFGLKGELYTGGPYRYSRNPQYVGMSVTLVGVLIMVNSGLLIVGTAPVFLWMYLLPFAEEPWLKQEFGEEYEEYRRNVPRFLGKRTITRMLE